MLFQNSLGQRAMLNESEVSGESLPFHFANHVTLILRLFSWCDSLGPKQLGESCAPLTHPERCKPVTQQWETGLISKKTSSAAKRITLFPTLAWARPERTLLSVQPLQTAVIQWQVVTLHAGRVSAGFEKFIPLSAMDLPPQLSRPLKNTDS